MSVAQTSGLLVPSMADHKWETHRRVLKTVGFRRRRGDSVRSCAGRCRCALERSGQQHPRLPSRSERVHPVIAARTASSPSRIPSSCHGRPSWSVSRYTARGGSPARARRTCRRGSGVSRRRWQRRRCHRSRWASLRVPRLFTPGLFGTASTKNAAYQANSARLLRRANVVPVSALPLSQCHHPAKPSPI